MLQVRSASLADTDALAALRLAWAEEKGAATSDAVFGERFADWLNTEAERRVFFLAEVDGDPVGMVNLTTFTRMPYPDSVDFAAAWGYLGNLFVLPTRRGAGVGRALVDACVKHASDHGFARVVLSPSAASVPLYERAGFTTAAGLMVWQP